MTDKAMFNPTPVLSTKLSSSSYEDNEKEASYPWKEKASYYFRSLADKMQLTASETCRANIIYGDDHHIGVSGDHVYNASYIMAASYPPDPVLVSWWRNIPRPRQMRVEPYLCEAVYMKRHPIFRNAGCQLPHYMHPSAPRCQTRYLQHICIHAQRNITDAHLSSSSSSSSYGYVLPESDHRQSFMPPIPYLMMMRDALVSKCGTVITACGYLHTTANCMATGNAHTARKFYASCQLPSPSSSSHDESPSSSGHNSSGAVMMPVCQADTPYGSDIIYHDKIFVLAQVDDSHVYHIHLEMIPRLIAHVSWLQQHEDVMLLVGCDATPSKESTRQGHRHLLQAVDPLLHLLGINRSRLIVHQHVYARKVYMPMEGACQDPVYNTWQILSMRQYFMNQIDPTKKMLDPYAINRHHKMKKRVMMLMKRSVGSKHTRNSQDSVRQWSDVFTQQLLQSLSSAFASSYDIVLFSDRNHTMMRCHACQVHAFYAADVVIGVHGAGLGNMLYMRPNSAVIEFAPYGNDGRCLLGGGPFSRLAAMMSHNYMMHHPPYQEYTWMRDKTCEFNITRFIQHISSFLTVIDFFP